ncbi:non-ribosomal peptide synthetase [Microcoleus vaginatus DQ-U2]|uniref:non-ribosomal peptide synthetase n=1 Tax=Microcoleus vaginatus TaxID=119532 RepID=UPI001689991A|nr:amino acid adenylation domain-containing protein [Microcoleus sp. FACHB-DQ6]
MSDRLKGGTLHQLFESQVERTPDAVAVVFEGQQLTYRDLNCRANQLARYLQNSGVKPEVLVGICVERSLQIVVAILAVLKAGGAYVPLDPTYPQERLAFMLEDSQVLLLLTQASLVESIPKHQSRVLCLDTDWETISCENEENPDTEVNTENLAYVLYTSGSTGKPKGVCCNHLGVINLLADFDLRQPLSVGDACSLWTSLSFDVSVYEIFSGLLTGGALHIVPERIRSDAKIFIEWLDFERICSAYIPPFMLNALFDYFKKSPEESHLKRLLVGVEPIYEQLLASISKKNTRLQIINGYGPTEATICATLYSVERETNNQRNTPIGKPVQNTEIYLLNEEMQPVSTGETGEIYIGGIGLGRGYLNRPNLTAEKFIVNPFSDKPGKRLYKTGDLARYLPDGNIEFVGRIDHQVKIRGFRIELAEIEASLRQHPDVQEAVAIAREDVPGDKRLVAYIVSNLIPERIPYQSPCLVEFDGSRTIEVSTEDISIGGISLVGITEILERGSRVRLHLQPPRNSQLLWVEGKVVWQEKQRTGIQFELTSTQQTTIQASVDYLLEQQKFLKVLQRTVSRNLRSFLKQKLPEYMVPSQFVILKELPLNSNGKLDRNALPSPRQIIYEQPNNNIELVSDIVENTDVLELERELELMPFVPPRTPVEEVVAIIWAKILGLDRVGIHDNFWECGGDSLLAAQVISRIRNTLEIELSLRSLFEAPTIAELAQQIEIELQTNSRWPLSPIEVIDRSQNLPLSFGEQQLWFLAQVEPGNPFYNEHFTIYLPSSIDRLALEQSFNQIIDRHEILRTNFSVVDGQPIRIVQPTCYLSLPLINLQEIASESDRETEALRLVTEKARQPFNLTSDLLLRTTVIQLSETDYRLYSTSGCYEVQ